MATGQSDGDDSSTEVELTTKISCHRAMILLERGSKATLGRKVRGGLSKMRQGDGGALGKDWEKEPKVPAEGTPDHSPRQL